jgi:hypothetical protein
VSKRHKRSKKICAFCKIEFNALKDQKLCSRSCSSKFSKNWKSGIEHFLFKKDKLSKKERDEQYARNYPERVLARKMVRYAIDSRKLLRKPCRICGNEKAEAHHWDYSKPLDVDWLCRIHHKQADKQMGLGKQDFKPKPTTYAHKPGTPSP